jgi:hypothetical protein
MKIVIHAAYGGFSLTLSRLPELIELYKKYIHEKEPSFVWSENFFEDDLIGFKIPRYDPCFVRAVEDYTDYTKLKVVEIPNDTDWMIEEYDGFEWVSQQHKIFTEYPLDVPHGILVGSVETQHVYTPPKDRPLTEEELSKAYDLYLKKNCVTQ